MADDVRRSDAEESAPEPPEEVTPVQMICATKILKPPPTRQNLRVIPRTAELGTIFSAVAFAIVGIIIGSMIGGFDAIVYGVVLGGSFGAIFLKLSPLSGESIFKWAELEGRSVFEKKVNYEGKRQQLSIGFAPVTFDLSPDVLYSPSARESRSSEVDSRGYPIIKKVVAGGQRDKLERQMTAFRKEKKLRSGTGVVSGRYKATTAQKIGKFFTEPAKPSKLKQARDKNAYEENEKKNKLRSGKM